MWLVRRPYDLARGPATAVSEYVAAQRTVVFEIVAHLTFQVSRHTYATLLLNSGADIKTVADIKIVAELMGDNLRNTEIYAKLLGETKRTAVDRMAALFDSDE